MPLDPDSFKARFTGAIKASEHLIEGQGQYAAEKFPELKKLLDETLDIPPESTHAFKLRSNSVDNCLWEGAPLSKEFQLGVAIVPTAVATSKPGNVAAFPAAVENRMYPGPNGFETLAICTPTAKGQWQVSDIVSEKGSGVAAKLHSLFETAVLHEAQQPAPQYYVKTLGDTSSSTAVLVSAIAGHLVEAKNIILQGPPGTGKTFLSGQVVAQIAGGIDPAQLGAIRFGHLIAEASDGLTSLLNGQDLGGVIWERVQLHPTYSYDDFVRGMTAVQQGGHMRFVPEDRLLVQLAVLARARPSTTFVLLLDEINRCNLTSVLGELIFAIEPGARNLPVRLQYEAPAGGHSDDALALPDNLLFIGTMNTADRSLGIVDYAIRRRFRFLDLLPSVAALAEYYGNSPQKSAAARKLFENTNASIVDADLRIGQSYFMTDPSTPNWHDLMVERVFYEVIPMLREYVAEGRIIEPQLIDLMGAKINLASVNRDVDAVARKALSDALQV